MAWLVTGIPINGKVSSAVWQGKRPGYLSDGGGLELFGRNSALDTRQVRLLSAGFLQFFQKAKRQDDYHLTMKALPLAI